MWLWDAHVVQYGYCMAPRTLAMIVTSDSTFNHIVSGHQFVGHIFYVWLLLLTLEKIMAVCEFKELDRVCGDWD